ncbi:acylphosphatase [Halomonas halocynthiae]|uniref:acylphosphatase n=1 Tax=Halomonas halocynthiae TaxID=176290 RepID=UPI0003F923B9|nr:acylphosphatase [Halomonas halocynthiae]
MSSLCVKARISGKVQGVWYRRSTQQKAVSLGVTGHAINLEDGSVEVLMYGGAMQVDALSQWLWQGSEDAQVAKVELEPVNHDASKPLPDAFTTG